ncbi:uncharacterized protein LOC129587676 [Paramacrobiotus metropolitanus]|uniref:uncharacterized protein LOC129587676 n=1 Tax=Paramacrobiotus metropolitanus TaxID=2943436 RepID=UPI002446530A|nr:uncharacterized protein LOC129587676 [Paramacrobiotus metropolitanus]
MEERLFSHSSSRKPDLIKRFVRAIFILVLLLWKGTCGFVISTDSTYGRWPGGDVYYAIPQNEYNLIELNVIREAMLQIQADSGNCVRFREVSLPAPPGIYFVVITRTGGLSGPNSLTCYSFPGIISGQYGRGQYMAMQPGINGCLGNRRQAMRILASLLGLRSEHNKPNRDTFLLVNTNNINPVGMLNQVFNTYDRNKVIFDQDNFDFNSITLLDPFTFTSNGNPTITAKGGFNIQNVGRLSVTDCTAIKVMYQCPSVQCADLYGNSAFPVFTLGPPAPTIAPTVAGTTTTTPVLRPDFKK